jgi:hypothetical protein
MIIRATSRGAVLSYALIIASLLSSANAQTSPRSPDYLRTYGETQALWDAFAARNPKLAAAEQFMRSYVTEVRLTGKIIDFGDEFTDLLGSKDAEDRTCEAFLLCKEQIVPAFRMSAEPGVTDIVRYTLEMSCFGFVPTAERRLRALELLNGVAKRVGYANIPITEADRSYLRTGLVDALATAEDEWGREGTIGRFWHLRQWIKLATGKTRKGRVRPLSDHVKQAATAACG